MLAAAMTARRCSKRIFVGVVMFMIVLLRVVVRGLVRPVTVDASNGTRPRNM